MTSLAEDLEMLKMLANDNGRLEALRDVGNVVDRFMDDPRTTTEHKKLLIALFVEIMKLK